MNKILVIEDEHPIRECIQDILEGEGFVALGAADGITGVQIAQQHLPDLIICDIHLPGMDGYSVLETLNHDPATTTIPFIFLTARGTRDDLRHGMELGADDYLIKPCSMEELLRAIAKRLEKQATLQSQSQKQLETLRSNITVSLPHELHTPLTAILGLSEVLIEDYNTVDPTEILEISQTIHHSANRLYKLVQNFLLFAQLELASQKPESARLDANDEIHYPGLMIADQATYFAQKAGRADDLHLALIDIPIYANETRLKKIVEELLDNAFKFSQPGVPVTITGTVDKQGYILTIQDQGRGMSSEQLAHLGAYMQFDRKFYEQQGLGLGLIIVKRMLELYGGQFAIQSTPDQGTSVQAIFPRVET